jgi:hypothetical protein
MAASCCTCMAWAIVPPHASGVVLAPWACVVRPGPTHLSEPDLSCEAETSRVMRRLLVRGGDLSCEAETSRGDPSSAELVGDAANWPKTGCLASVGLDQGP